MRVWRRRSLTTRMSIILLPGSHFIRASRGVASAGIAPADHTSVSNTRPSPCQAAIAQAAKHHAIIRGILNDNRDFVLLSLHDVHVDIDKDTAAWSNGAGAMMHVYDSHTHVVLQDIIVLDGFGQRWSVTNEYRVCDGMCRHVEEFDPLQRTAVMLRAMHNRVSIGVDGRET